MKKSNLLRLSMLVILMALTTCLVSQPYPTGGYQGGTHGNIKYTIWSGTVDNNWAEPGNWCPAEIPDEEDTVVIPASVTIMPEVKSAGMKCKRLNIEPGAELNIKDGYILTVNGTEVQ